MLRSFVRIPIPKLVIYYLFILSIFLTLFVYLLNTHTVRWCQSWGLGESVVDGSVTADRYIVDKINNKLIKQTLGVKGIEKRLDVSSGQAGSSSGGGGVIEHIIEENDPRRTRSSLTKQQLQELTKLVCIVEDTYGMPMDIEWAFITGKYTDNYSLDLKLLQARPITTLFCLDTKMMTRPGERRKLYFDGNIISEATTTSPFTTMDLDFFCKVTIILVGPKSLREAKDKNWKLYSESSDMPMFNSSTRQYCNMSHIFKYMSTQSMSNVRCAVLCCVVLCWFVLCTKYATVVFLF
jgi:hypothetical protein